MGDVDTESADAPKEREFGGSTHLLQIGEPDLAELERILPEWAQIVTFAQAPRSDEGTTANPGGRINAQIRRVQDILQSIRWDGLPYSQVGIIPAEDDDQPPATSRQG